MFIKQEKFCIANKTAKQMQTIQMQIKNTVKTSTFCLQTTIIITAN